MKLISRLLVASCLVAVSSAAAAQSPSGILAWNGLCSPGVFLMLDVSCGTSDTCKLYQKIGSNSATMLAELTSGESPIIADVPHGVTSSWWVEKSDVAVTDTNVIDGATLCTDN